MRDSNCSISCWITEAISSALNFMGAPVNHLLTDGVQLVGDRGVVARRRRRGRRRRRSNSDRRSAPAGALRPRLRRSRRTSFAAKASSTGKAVLSFTRTHPRRRSHWSQAWRRMTRMQSSRPCRDTTLRKFKNAWETWPPRTRSRILAFLFVRDQGGGEDGLQLGELDEEFVDQGVKLRHRLVGLAGLFPRPQRAAA